jgi:hypothetical protein
MAKSKTDKSLTIRRDIYEDVTSIPHFPIEIQYVGHHVSFEDIYFDRPELFLEELRTLEEKRKGEVLLDGGLRIRIWFKATPRGGVSVSFRSEEFEPIFPGNCILKGSFSIDGECVKQLVNSFKKLFSDGTPVTI